MRRGRRRPRIWNTRALRRWPGVTIPIHDHSDTYFYDAAAAQHAVDFFPEMLVHHKGEWVGRPFELLDWQRELIIRPLFGWKRAADGYRRFRKVLLLIPKKQGKTQLVAGLSVYVLYCDGEPGAEIMTSAADRHQAEVLFKEASAMVEDNPILKERSEIYRRSIVYTETRSVLQVISADARTKHGPNLHCVIIDELHAQPNRALFEALTKGVAARRQPVIFLPTTAGEDGESIAKEEYDYAKSLIAGVIQDDTYLPVIFEADPKTDDWRAPRTWRKANPSLGVTVQESYYRQQVLEALNEPRKQNAFKQLHLNIWTNQVEAWVPVEAWDACEVSTVLTENRAQAFTAAAGVDLSSLYDLTSCVIAIRRHDLAGDQPTEVVLREKTNGEPAAEPADASPLGELRLMLNFAVDFIPYFWLPEDTLVKRAKDDRVPYDAWRDAGFLRVTPGNTIDQDQIFRDLTDDILPRWGVQSVGYDQWNALWLANALERKKVPVAEIPQTLRMLSAPSKVWEALIISKRARHDGHELLRWNVSNVGVKRDANDNIRPVKISEKKRIDGVVASILALRTLLTLPPKRVSTFQGLMRV